jgi:hypothetical protein
MIYSLISFVIINILVFLVLFHLIKLIIVKDEGDKMKNISLLKIQKKENI